jgi:SAM-dependent methyltransferase
MGETLERPLPAVPLPFTGERFTSAISGQIEIEHFHRYLYARELCYGKDVLDVASGEGYGSALLAQVATSVTGIEIAREAVDHARASYQSANLRFLEGDARQLPIASASFDVVVSFETIEHIAEHDSFLQEVRRVLRPNGVFIVSTPDRDNYSRADSPPNPYHALELSRDQFVDLLLRYFEHALCSVQRPIDGSVLFPLAAEPSEATPICFEKTGDRYFERSLGLPQPPYLVAVASAKKIKCVVPSILIEAEQIESVRGRVAVLTQELAAARSQAEIEANSARQAWERELAATRAQAASDVAELRQNLDRASQAMETERRNLLGQIAELRENLDRASQAVETQRRNLLGQIANYQKQLAAAEDLILATRRALAATHGSLSWRLTRPLRIAKGFFVKRRNKRPRQ